MLSIVERVLRLKNTLLFECLATDELKVVAQIAQEEEREANQVIFRQGEKGNKLYIIISGKISLYDKEGSLDLLLSESDFFGEMAILAHKPRSLSARTKTHTRLLVIRQKAFEDLIHRYPQIALGIIKAMSQRLLRHDEEIRRLAAMVEKSKQKSS